MPDILGRRPLVALQDAAVAQGLGAAPAMRDVEFWGVLIIGTSLGNARSSKVP